MARAESGIKVIVAGVEREFPADKRVRMGRDPDNDIVIDNPHVSRQHAVLSREGDAWILESLNPGGLNRQGTAATRLTIATPSEVWLAAPPTGERIQVAPLGAANAPTQLSPSEGTGAATIVAPGAAASAATSPTALTPGGPLQRSGGIRVRLGDREQHFDAGTTVTIGRLPSSDVQAQSEFASREHARLRSDRGRWVLENLGQHGTFLAGSAITSLTLTEATSVRLGDPQQGDALELIPDDAAAATQVPPRAAPAVPATGQVPAPAGGGAPVPGGALAADRVTGNTSVIRRLTTQNRRTAIFAGVAVALALILGITAVIVSVNGGNDGIEGVVQEATPKTAFVKGTDQRSWSGTGAILDAERGFAVTNAHVVEGHDAFQVGVNGEIRAAELNGVAPCDDLAALQIADPSGLQQFELANQADLQSGQQVVALGYPVTFSEQPKLQATDGVISNTQTDYADAGYTNLIQSTAPINPGNSGGPLVDLDGQLVGINTLYKFTEINDVPDSRPVQNEYYAIASDRVAEIVPTLESGTSIGYDGIGPRNLSVVTPVAALGIPEKLVLISAIDDGSPAQQADLLKPGTVDGTLLAEAILKIDGQPILSAGDYCDAIRDLKEGQGSATYTVGVFALGSNADGQLVATKLNRIRRPAVDVKF